LSTSASYAAAAPETLRAAWMPGWSAWAWPGGRLILAALLTSGGTKDVGVLLVRIPARALLGGKIAGIGLLGLAQIAVTALAALIAVTTVHSVDVPAVRGAVLAWAIAWFVLGYALYATVFGALGSLGSRAEDAQSVAGPVMVVLPVAYFASFAMIAQPAGAASTLISSTRQGWQRRWAKLPRKPRRGWIGLFQQDTSAPAGRA
jgi:ABC-2 family transporter